MSKTGETVTFEYNEDGLRTKKTATSTGTTEYTLHGKNIVHLKNGSTELHFFYGAQNRPAVVLYNGSKYRYLYNLQGDVLGLIDESNCPRTASGKCNHPCKSGANNGMKKQLYFSLIL